MAEHPHESRSLSESRAMELVREVLNESGIVYERRWDVEVGQGASLPVDVRFSGSDFGIEWVSPQDRIDHGDSIPGPDADGQLRILPGVGANNGAQILVLDHESYRYDPHRQNVDRGATGVREVESRVRRDLRDFLEYVRGQGGF
jgi:hypothetical protein